MVKKESTVIYNRKKISFPDFIIITVIVSFAVMMMVFNLRNGVNEDMIAVVKQNTEELLTVNLSKLSEPYIYIVDNEFHTVIEFNRDSVKIISSDCKDKICVNTGELNKIGQSAVCLPARVSVEIRGSGPDNVLDGVTG